MKKLIALALCGVLMISSAAAFSFEALDPSEVFSQELREKETREANPSSWAVGEIEAAKTCGLVPSLTGDPGYQSPITREQFAELIVNGVKVISGTMPSAGDAAFSDTSNIRVLMAANSGIVNGVGGGQFNPKAPTNREQIAAMLQRAWNVVGTPVPAADLGIYSDAGAVSGWATDAVGSMVASGIMKGTSDTTLSPQAPCTVEQAILLVYRLYQQVQ